MQHDVIIVGAGTAGLMAARELGRAGKKVLILEARDRIGGRIFPQPAEEWGYPAQGGGEFVHGEAPVTCELVKEAGLTFEQPTEWWNVFDGEPRVLERIEPVDPRLKAKLDEVTGDMTIAKFFEAYFPGDEFKDMREFVEHWIAGYDAGDINRASVRALRGDMDKSARWDQRTLKETYAALLSHLKRQCDDAGVEIALIKEVAAIDHAGEIVSLRCVDGSTYEAPKALITVPLPFYERLQFEPPLPDKVRAASQIGFGQVIKILLRFKTKWWTGIREQKFERLFFMFSSEAVPTWWTQYPEPHTTLTGWIAGTLVEPLKDKSEAELIELALQSLSNIFSISLQELKEQLVIGRAFNWIKDPYALGAYSYTTPESAEAIEALREAVGNKLFFAGEALNHDDLVATVDAALTSGKEVANEILRA